MKPNRLLFLSVFTLSISSCVKEQKKPDVQEAQTLKTYSLKNVTNIGYNNSKGGIDLYNGLIYSAIDGQLIDSTIDLAYAYIKWGTTPVYERTFIQPSNSLVDVFFKNYKIRNATEITGTDKYVNFDSIALVKTKGSLDNYFPLKPVINFAGQISNNDEIVQFPYYFFKTVKGKRGIIKVLSYTKSVNPNYYFEPSPIDIEVIIEK